MISVTLFKILMSFVCGGAAVVLVTYLAQKLGSKVGGALSGFPTTILVSLFFIGLLLGPEAVQTSSISTLVTLSLFGVFCIVYVNIYHLGTIRALCVSLLVWFLVSLPVMVLKIDQIHHGLVAFLIIACFSFYILSRKKFDVKHEQMNPSKQKPEWNYLLRFLLGGTVIALASSISYFFDESVGGVFAGFPATATSSIIILSSISSAHFVANYIKNQFFGGAINCSIYIIGVYFLYPLVGIYWGTLMAVMLSMTSACIMYLYLRKI